MKELAKEKETDEKKRKRGRPKKAITRSVSLVVRMTPTERLAIESRATSAGMPISEWFRKTARTAVIIPRLSREETSYLRTLSGMANNLNQLTKLAHKSGLVSFMTDLRRLLNEVERLMERMGRDDS
jgi:Bacterial mobilisation protein (MobC).